MTKMATLIGGSPMPAIFPDYLAPQTVQAADWNLGSRSLRRVLGKIH
jgi:hypothetical protein